MSKIKSIIFSAFIVSIFSPLTLLSKELDWTSQQEGNKIFYSDPSGRVFAEADLDSNGNFSGTISFIESNGTTTVMSFPVPDIEKTIQSRTPHYLVYDDLYKNQGKYYCDARSWPAYDEKSGNYEGIYWKITRFGECRFAAHGRLGERPQGETLRSDCSSRKLKSVDYVMMRSKKEKFLVVNATTEESLTKAGMEFIQQVRRPECYVDLINRSPLSSTIELPNLGVVGTMKNEFSLFKGRSTKSPVGRGSTK